MTMFGFESCAAHGTAPLANNQLEMASAASVSFRTFALKSIAFLLQANLFGLL